MTTYAMWRLGRIARIGTAEEIAGEDGTRAATVRWAAKPSNWVATGAIRVERLPDGALLCDLCDRNVRDVGAAECGCMASGYLQLERKRPLPAGGAPRDECLWFRARKEARDGR